MAEQPKPDQPNVQGMIDDIRSRVRRQRIEVIGICPTCHQTIRTDNSGHLPECNHTEFPQESDD